MTNSHKPRILRLALENEDTVVRVELHGGAESWDRAIEELDNHWRFRRLGCVRKEDIKRLYFWNRVTKNGFEYDPGKTLKQIQDEKKIIQREKQIAKMLKQRQAKKERERPQAAVAENRALLRRATERWSGGH
jgi:hypothetical protein